jgi:hypothetical protein
LKNTSLISKGKLTLFGHLQKIREKPNITPKTQIFNTTGIIGKSDKEKPEIFADHLSEVFSPHNNYQDQEVEQDLATPIQWQERLKTFTLKEIKMKSKC